ncbi:MAG TPA: sigma-70 family RNA polymerase sigma factor [Methylophilaceae bacterium]|jgi:RNA polymerase sigma-70 factor (ECF subfamily)
MTTTANVNDWLNDHGDYLYRFALARLRDPVQAEDAVQETMLAAIQSKSFTGQSSPRTWLVGILKHKIIDTIRQQIRERPTEDLAEDLSEDTAGDEYFDEDNRHWNDAPQAWGVPDGALEQKQFLVILQSCMDKLPKKLASLFMLREVIEEDNEKICKDLEITTTNAWVMLYRARMGLRQCLELHWLGR